MLQLACHLSRRQKAVERGGKDVAENKILTVATTFQKKGMKWQIKRGSPRSPSMSSAPHLRKMTTTDNHLLGRVRCRVSTATSAVRWCDCVAVGVCAGPCGALCVWRKHAPIAGKLDRRKQSLARGWVAITKRGWRGILRIIFVAT